MPFDRFMIAPPQGGLQTNLKPWLIPDDAFAQLNNAYVFRGRVKKRFGSYLMNQSAESNIAQLSSRLRLQVATTAVTTGNLVSTVMPGAVWAIGQQFSVGTTIFTVTQASGATLTTGVAGATYNTANGRLVITGFGTNPSTPVYFYPATPVMGLISYETDVINDEPLYAFDTQFSYRYTGGNNGAWELLDPNYVWLGNDSQFFWGATYRGALNSEQFLFITNNHIPDRMTYWDGANMNTFSPIVNETTRIYTARIIIPFKNRLLILNTIEGEEGILVGTTDGSGNLGSTAVTGGIDWEVGQSFTDGTTIFTINTITHTTSALTVNTGSTLATPPTATLNIISDNTGNLTITGNGSNKNTNVYFMPGTGGATAHYFNRCRYSQNGNPVSVNAWYELANGLASYLDAPTSEQIITTEFIKDRLIVYFERSTWELVYTGNEVIPFRWQQINSELGSESTFSVVPFDKVNLAIGNVGVHACNGANVQRIDNNIPDQIFDISNNNAGVDRVHAIRDYFTELIYWTFPSLDANGVYPNRVLVYNYQTGTWSFNDDSFTCFGYYQDQSNFTWASSGSSWEESSYSWNSATIQSKFKQVVAGNQQGFVSVIDADENRNAPSLQISKLVYIGSNIRLTCINHNLVNDEYVAIENLYGVTGIAFPNNIFVIQRIDSDTIQIAVTDNVFGLYLGGGTLARVSEIDILTKQYNFYVQDGRNAYIQKVDFLVDKTDSGEITIDTYVSSTELSQIQNGQVTGAIIGSGVLETSPYALSPLEQVQTRLWHPIYTQAEGECVQLHIYLSPDQMLNADIAWEDFQMHAFTFYASPTSSRLQ